MPRGQAGLLVGWKGGALMGPTQPGPEFDFLTLARTRRSIRRYRPDPVPDELLTQVLEAARWAPSAVNSQPWVFVVVTEKERRQTLADKARILGLVTWKHLAAAPVVVAIVGDLRGNRYATVDCSLAGMNLMLAAHSLGLGTCWVGGFAERAVASVLGVPKDRAVVGLITLGYPAEIPKAPPRLPLDRLVLREVFDPGLVATRGERLKYSGLYSLRKRIAAFLRGGRKRS